eukprot:1150320-Pelagomonas_calceolata.AAC.2
MFTVKRPVNSAGVGQQVMLLVQSTQSAPPHVCRLTQQKSVTCTSQTHLRIRGDLAAGGTSCAQVGLMISDGIACAITLCCPDSPTPACAAQHTRIAIANSPTSACTRMTARKILVLTLGRAPGQ